MASPRPRGDITLVRPVIPDRASDGSSSTKAGRRKGNSDGFEQVEPTGILTANSDPGQQVAVLTPPSASANTQALSADSYLISGAVGRGSTAGLARSER